ncbi:MAG TPA: tetratricopeptide repeat protein [Candidatus Polarisedimenticolia bacterium]|nr:tetratricopeptide repeat protein [Candidatus Polarisedimenticolia bacterium]
MKRLIAIAAVVLVVAAIFSSVSFVGGEEIAVLDPRFGDPQILGRGIHLHLPFLSRVTHYPLKPEKVESETKLETRDNLNFTAKYTLESTFDPETLLAFHARRGGRPVEVVRRQAGDEAVREGAALLRADEILGAATPERWMAVLLPPCRKAGIRPIGITVQPIAATAMVNAALIYQQRNLPRAALNLAKMAVDRYGSDPMAHYGLGRVYEAQGRGDDAEAEYIQALFLDPAAKEPMAELVGRLLKRKDFTRAQRLIAAGLEKDRLSAPHYNWMGITMQLQGRLDDARTAFQKAVELDQKNAEYRANLGALELARSDPKSAEESLKDAIRINPNHSLALYNLGIAVAEQGRNAEAVPFFERAEKSGPATVGLLNALAHAYQQIGDKPRAAATLRRSLALNPNQPEQQKILKQLGPVKSPT